MVVKVGNTYREKRTNRLCRVSFKAPPRYPLPIEIEYLSEDGKMVHPLAIAWVRAEALEKV